MASALDKLRAKYTRRSDIGDPFITINIETLKSAGTWFDVIAEGGIVAGFLKVKDLRLKFGTHSGALLSMLAQREAPFLRDLYTKFRTNPGVDAMFRGAVELALNESQQEITRKAQEA